MYTHSTKRVVAGLGVMTWLQAACVTSTQVHTGEASLIELGLVPPSLSPSPPPPPSCAEPGLTSQPYNDFVGVCAGLWT